MYFIHVRRRQTADNSDYSLICHTLTWSPGTNPAGTVLCPVQYEPLTPVSASLDLLLVEYVKVFPQELTIYNHPDVLVRSGSHRTDGTVFKGTFGHHTGRTDFHSAAGQTGGRRAFCSRLSDSTVQNNNSRRCGSSAH